MQEPGGYRLPLSTADVDAFRFSELARTGRARLREGRPDTAAQQLREALQLWRGPALPELDDPAPAGRLDEQRLDALEDRIEAAIQLDGGADVVAECEALAADHPLRERFTWLLMTALAGAGRTNEALAGYERLRRYPVDQLGTDPSAELQRLHLTLLRSEPERPSRTVTRTNLRTGRTTFLGRADELNRIAELLDSGRLVTVVGPGGAGKTRLAGVAASDWVGRLDDGVWLVELAPVTDPVNLAQAIPGSLGLRANTTVDRRAEQAMSTEDRLFDVLADSDCLLVLDNCEHVITDLASLADRLLASCPRLRILATSREALAIDREALCQLPPLRLPPVGADADEALGLPSVQLFTDRAAAVSADFRVDSDTVGAVVEIVRRLDGLPLAIELAAARLRVLPVHEIAARLSDRFRLLTGGNRAAMPRHRTLRAVVEWSWDLLTPTERLLAERLAVFPSGATIESASRICADPALPAALPSGEDDVVELLSQLVDKSLLQSGLGSNRSRNSQSPSRYRMLETLREYGIEQLAARHEADGVRLVHARYFADLVAEAEPSLTRGDQLVAIGRLEDERDNILAALRYFGDCGHARAAVEMTRALGWYWTLLGGHSEATTWLRFALSVPDPAGTVPARDRVVVEALHAINTMATTFGDNAPEDVEDGVARLEELNVRLDEVDAAGDPVILMLRPMMLFFSRSLDRAFELLDDAVQASDPWVRATSYMFRAAINENEGRVPAMRADVDTALALFTDLGDRWGMASTLSARGQLHVLDGQLPEAISAYQRAADSMAEFGATADEMMFRLRLSDLHARIGDFDGARREAALVGGLDLQAGSRTRRLLADGVTATMTMLLGERDEMRRLAGRLREDVQHLNQVHPMNGHVRASTLAVLGTLESELGDPALAGATLTAAYDCAVGTRDMPILAAIGLAVAGWAEASERPQDAAEMLGATISLRGADDPTDPLAVRLRSRLDTALGSEPLAAAVASGRALGRADAIERIRPGTIRET